MNLAPILSYQGPELDIAGNFAEGQKAGILRDEMSRKQEGREKMQGVLDSMSGDVDYERAALEMLPVDPDMAGTLMGMATQKLSAQKTSADIANDRIKAAKEKIVLETKLANGAISALEGVEEPEQKQRIYGLFMKSVEAQGVQLPDELKSGWSPENEENLRGIAEIGQMMLDMDPENLTAEQRNYREGLRDPAFREYEREFSGGSSSPEMQAWETFHAENPEVPYRTFMSQYRKGITGAELGSDGVVGVIPGAPEAVKGISKADESGTQEAKTEAISEQAAEELKAEKVKMKPKATASYKATMAKTENVSNKIQSTIPNVGAWTSGFIGDTAKHISGTPAADLAANLKTIKANLGFEALQEMRNNSPTGGALGSIAVQELEALQATWQNLEQSQSPEQLKENLMQLDKDVAASRERIKAAFEKDYGEGAETPDVEAKRARLEELRKRKASQ
jgi:hypothetical protein